MPATDPDDDGPLNRSGDDSSGDGTSERAEPEDLTDEALESLDVTPVTRDRLVAWMQRNSQRHFIGSDGQLGGVWNGCMFTFALAGKGSALQVRGQWNRHVAIERRQELTTVLNERHARMAWPKVFLLVLDDGSVRVAAERAVFIGAGLSEAQLDRALRGGLASAMAAFADLDTRYPDPISQSPLES